jgi:hypothetical protein
MAAILSSGSPPPSTEGGDDPIIVKGSGTSAKSGRYEDHWVTITLETEEKMGWKIVKDKGATVIIIPEETAIWKLKTDGKKKIVLECPGKEITGINVANMTDEAGNNVPRKQIAKEEKYPEIKILNGK